MVTKNTRVASGRLEPYLIGRRSSLVLADSLSRDGVSLKITGGYDFVLTEPYI